MAVSERCFPQLEALKACFDCHEEFASFQVRHYFFQLTLAEGSQVSFQYTNAPASLLRPSYVNNFKHLLLRNRLANQNQISCESSLGRGHLGQLTKMATMPTYGKNPSKIFYSGNGGPISMKLGMQHWGLHLNIVCSDDDPGLTLTYFTAWSNFVTGFSIGKSENSGFFRNYCSL